MADNDYALGRIVEYLSQTPWWREMAIFVTEDDAQGGRDHIDAHRTVLMGLGPYFKRNYVSHVNTSFPGMLKTIFRLLGLPPLNLFDAVGHPTSATASRIRLNMRATKCLRKIRGCSIRPWRASRWTLGRRQKWTIRRCCASSMRAGGEVGMGRRGDTEWASGRGGERARGRFADLTSLPLS